MKLLLTNLMTASLIATPVAITSHQLTSITQKNNANKDLSINSNGLNISASTSITYQWWKTSSTKYSSTAQIICLDDVATSLSDFVQRFPKLQLSNTTGGGYITEDYISYTNPIYPVPHDKGNYDRNPITLNTADIFKIGENVDSTIGSYKYSDFSTSSDSETHVVTGLTTIAGKTFLSISCYAYVTGHAGPFSQWEYDIADVQITKARFLTS